MRFLSISLLLLGCTSGDLSAGDPAADVGLRPDAGDETSVNTDGEEPDGVCTAESRRACGRGEGACVAGEQVCVDAAWGACEVAVGPTDETCNGLDDDCDGLVDDGLAGAPACPLQTGVCEGAVAVCAGGAWAPCDAARYRVHDARYLEDEGPPACDGLDQDCDGRVDEGCDCQAGAERPCGRDEGACQVGTEACNAGAWEGCDAVRPGVEVCGNGVDDDCDGVVDNACFCSRGTQIQIDNDLPGSGYSEEPAANWLSRPVDACHGSYRYLSHTVGDGTRRGRAFWRPAITIEGWYRVVTSFRATENRTADADYYLRDDRGGVVHRAVNQRDGSGCTRVDLGLVFCAAGGQCHLELHGDDGASDSADMTTFTLEGCEAPGTADPVDPSQPDCRGISANPAWELCESAADRCAGVFTDGAGCQAFCAAAGMRCTARFGGSAGCSREPENPIQCDADTGHQSDWCECAP